ncbi:MAG: hypothetical protein ACFFED_18630 [Candidatus Thorarchaeota archaeon]
MPENSEDPEIIIKKNMLEAAGIDPDPELLKQPFSVILREIQLVQTGVKKRTPSVEKAAPLKESTTPKATEESGARLKLQEYGGETKRKHDEMLVRIKTLSDSLIPIESETIELAKQIRMEIAPELEEIVSQQERLAKSAWVDEKTMCERRNKIDSLGKDALKKTERFIKKPNEVKTLSRNTLNRIEALRKSSSSRQKRVEKIIMEQQNLIAEIQRLYEEAS